MFADADAIALLLLSIGYTVCLAGRAHPQPLDTNLCGTQTAAVRVTHTRARAQNKMKWCKFGYY